MLNKKGIGASGSYPKSVFEVNEIRKICNINLCKAETGIQIAQKIITLPTHYYVKDEHIETIYNTFKHFLV